MIEFILEYCARKIVFGYGKLLGPLRNGPQKIILLAQCPFIDSES